MGLSGDVSGQHTLEVEADEGVLPHLIKMLIDTVHRTVPYTKEFSGPKYQQREVWGLSFKPFHIFNQTLTSGITTCASLSLSYCLSILLKINGHKS